MDSANSNPGSMYLAIEISTAQQIALTRRLHKSGTDVRLHIADNSTHI